MGAAPCEAGLPGGWRSLSGDCTMSSAAPSLVSESKREHPGQKHLGVHDSRD